MMKKLLLALGLVLAFAAVGSAQYYYPPQNTGRYMAPDGTVYVNGVPVGRMNPSDIISPPHPQLDPYGRRHHVPGNYNPVWNN